MPPPEVTAESIIARFAEDVAFVAEEEPAEDVQDFISQLEVVSERLESVRLDEEREADSAATYLADAARTDDAVEQQVLLTQAEQHLFEATPWIDEYRDMV